MTGCSCSTTRCPTRRGWTRASGLPASSPSCASVATGGGWPTPPTRSPRSSGRDLRILLTIHHPLDAGTGAPGVTVALRDAYRAAGHRTHVLSFDDLPVWLPDQAKELLFPLLVAARLARGETPDVVDASSGDTWVWGRLRRVLRRNGVVVCRSHGLAHTFWDVEAREAGGTGRALSLRSRLYHGDLRLRQDAADLRGADVCLFLNA